MIFEQAFNHLLLVEKGFTISKKDPGNWTGGKCGHGLLKGTKYGISAASYPQLDIRNLSLTDAQAIYKRDYWELVKADALPETIRFDMFDMAVNSGVGTAKLMLQKALGVKADGIMGPVTLKAAFLSDPEMLDKRLSALRLLYICELKTFADFGRGWVRRIANNLLKD